MRKTDAKLDMWEYWREDKGLECAAEEYYPKLFASDPILLVAMMQLKQAKQTIDARMAILSGTADSE